MDADEHGWLSPEKARRLRRTNYFLCFICILQGLLAWNASHSKWEALERQRQFYEQQQPVSVPPAENLQPVPRIDLPIT
ncbi:hypothetical protein K2D_40280 [Planctomycetes bacterium K2D]|uniref:Uncharacterized protein n=1 Tax=Botrimarina mediterranea TaxID=2528022 RepID=A0A518KDD1_9BACT|nr:hypothetical protein Spa11_40250 [Botrimarina mediterranea]QDV80399.1 hypothetical protein K2D_40280 [Planctomycetes bacterium K2D]